MKTIAFWHEYPGQTPEPPKPSQSNDTEAVMLVWFVFVLVMALTAGK